MGKWVKDIQKGNRTFRLTFIEDTVMKGLWHCVGEEIYRKKKNIFDFTWKEEVFEFYTGNGDIVKKAMNKINDIFGDEKSRGKTIQILDDFVKEGK